MQYCDESFHVPMLEPIAMNWISFRGTCDRTLFHNQQWEHVPKVQTISAEDIKKTWKWKIKRYVNEKGILDNVSYWPP